MTWDEALDLIAAKMRDARRTLRRRVGPALLLRRIERPAHERPRGRALLPAASARRGSRARSARRRPARRRRRCTARWPASPTPTTSTRKLIVVWGCNPSASGIHLVAHIKKAQKHGAKLVVIDPRRTPLARMADLHLPVRPGTDLPVALAVIRELFERGRADRDVPATRTPTASTNSRRAADAWPIERAAAEAGIDAGDLATFAEWYGTTRPAVIRCGWGQERNRNGGGVDAGDPGAAGGRREVRRARRRLHDEQLGRVGHHRRDADRRAGARRRASST